MNAGKPPLKFRPEISTAALNAYIWQMENNTAFERLLSIMDDLREKCPWDKKQTIHTLRQQSIEELYELADAITSSDWK